jgi:hypothetical protein
MLLLSWSGCSHARHWVLGSMIASTLLDAMAATNVGRFNSPGCFEVEIC